MKKIFTLLCVALCATSLFANVVTGTCGDNLNWSYDTETKALTITGSGDMYWDFGKRPWEQVAGNIISVSLPDGLTSIEGGAFQNCQSLTSITIPNGVTSIGGNSFENCYALSSISIPNSVISIEDGAFQHCLSLTSITIPNGVTIIKRLTFYNCSSLTEVIIPNSVTHIGDQAFLDCPSLVSITLPNSITTIEVGTFSGCNSLTSITIPSSVENIGGNAFYDCEQVTMEGSTPPSIETSTFNDNAMILVPCSAMDNYLSAPIWQFMDLKGYNYKVNLTSTSGGNARITSAGGCASNVITIEATVTDWYYYYFKQWSDGNTDNPRTFTLTEDISVEAEFEPYKFYTFTLEGTSLSGEYEGLIEYIRPDAYSVGTIGFYGETQISRSVREGSVVTFSEQETGPTWLGWSDGITENGRSVVITSDTTISSVYGESTYYTIKISGSSLYGRVYDWYFYGETYVEFEALKGTEVYFQEEGSGCGTWLGWSDGSYDRERTIVVTSDTTITSRFDVETYSVSITAGEGGYLENGNIEREYNECNRDWIYTCAYANEGYYFAGWSDGNTNQCIDIYPYEDIKLVAQFAPKTQVTVLVGVDNASKDMGSVSGSGIFYSGDVVTISATPNNGYHFVEWSDGNGNATRELYLQSDTTLFATFAVGEYGGKCGNDLYWTYSDNTIAITGSSDMDLDTYPAWKSYYYDDWYANVSAVQFPEGITSIDDYAFNGMSLTSIIVPASVTYFGENAFAYNDNLTRFEYLGTTAEYNYNYPILYYCDNLRYFKGTQDMVSYWDHYDNLDTIIVTSGEGCGYYEARYIDNSRADDWYIGGDYADNVVEVETLILQNGLQEIGNYALYNARHLEQITIPAGVTRIGESAFEECRSLESVTFTGTALREIGDWAFYNCHRLKNITIPEGVTSIGKAAFFNCSYLKEITLPSTVQTVADNAFGQCQKVAKMTVNAMTPPIVEAETFEDIDRSIPLYVPIGTALQYKAADYWCEFFNVIEYNAPTAIDNIPSSTANTCKLLRNGQLLILRDGKTYTIMGAEIK